MGMRRPTSMGRESELSCVGEKRYFVRADDVVLAEYRDWPLWLLASGALAVLLSATTLQNHAKLVEGERYLQAYRSGSYSMLTMTF